MQGGIYLGKVIAIGESLIDFVPNQIGTALKDVSGFTMSPGGAPAKVAACVSDSAERRGSSQNWVLTLLVIF